jgi:hypothetical protein
MAQRHSSSPTLLPQILRYSFAVLSLVDCTLNAFYKMKCMR